MKNHFIDFGDGSIGISNHKGEIQAIIDFEITFNSSEEVEIPIARSIQVMSNKTSIAKDIDCYFNAQYGSSLGINNKTVLLGSQKVLDLICRSATVISDYDDNIKEFV